MNNIEMQPQEIVRTEEEILALIDSDALEMPSWDQACYIQ